jgi:nicotinamidase-related amidase
MLPKGKPNKPKSKAVSLAADETAIAVLDLSARCQDPKEVCWKLMKPLGKFLERARARGVAIIYTISAHTRGTPMQEVALPLRRRDSEPVIYPDSFDKFFGGELQTFLSEKRVKNLVVAGSLTNVAVLYTSSSAARVYGYDVVMPLDGVNAHSRYEHEYAIHQFTILPRDTNKKFHFTTLSKIRFQPAKGAGGTSRFGFSIERKRKWLTKSTSC